MFSLILKPLLKKSTKTIDNIDIPLDTEISLSVIESGCLFISLDDEAVLIVINSPEDIKLLNNINNISFSFELIERPEFPSLAMHLEIKTVSNALYKFEYFFNTESIQEIDLLKKLNGQDHFDILFYDTKIQHSKTIQLSKEDKAELKSLINQATP